MTCTHAPITGFCFPCYTETRNATYARLQADLERLAAAGVTLLETWPGGRMTAWRWVNTGEPTTARITAESLSDDMSREHDAFIAGLTPAYLADHLTNRSRGFGTTVQAFCMDCGDETVPVTSDDDPACAACHAKRERLAIISAAADESERLSCAPFADLPESAKRDRALRRWAVR